MAVLKSENGEDIMIDCDDGCDEGMRIKILKDNMECYTFLTYTNGKFYRDQDDTVWRVLYKKLRKILAIIRNEDYYYSDIVLSKKDFELFKEYINKF